MANATTFPGDIVVPGEARISGSITPTRARNTILSQVELQPFVIPITSWRTWDAMGTNLPDAAGNDDLGLVGGTFGTAPPSLQSGDLKAAGATSRYARALIQLPWEYEAGQSVTLRFHAGMLTTVASTTATLDVSAYRSDTENGISADLCATAAQDINSLTFADFNFVITPTTLNPGDLLDVRIIVAVNDGATVTAVTAAIGKAVLLCDVR